MRGPNHASLSTSAISLSVHGLLLPILLTIMLTCTDGRSAETKSSAAACVKLDLTAAASGSTGAPLHIERKTGEDGKVVADTYVWKLPEGAPETLEFDLKALGIDPAEYDEFRFELMPELSQVNLSTQIFGYPASGQVSSWYLKFKAGADTWTEGRYDLRVDDDGAFLSGSGRVAGADGTMRLCLSRRVLGHPGEPDGRIATIRNPRFVRRMLDLSIDPRKAVMTEEGGDLVWSYPVTIANRTGVPQKVTFNPDAMKRLRYFRAETQAAFVLKPGETVTPLVRIMIDRIRAMSLPACYGEPAFPAVSVDGVEDSDAVPLMGYQRRAMWGVVPVFSYSPWSPPTFQAQVGAYETLIPGVNAWREAVLKAAQPALQTEWTVPVWEQAPGYDQNSRCADCGVWLVRIAPLEFKTFKCPKCGKLVEDDETVNRAMQSRYYGERPKAARDCALAWLLTGETDYAEKALQILDAFATVYDTMPVTGMRSTCGGSRLGGTTLAASYRLPVFAEAWALLKGYDGTGTERSDRIETFIREEALRIARHCVEYNNMQAEHFRAYGTAAIATGFWPLAAEAIYGDFGWHEVAEYGYSADGISHESGSYHHSIFHAMNQFAMFAQAYRIPLYTARFKRVFDGSILAGYANVSYEAAYAAYRDPAYLPIVNKGRQRIGEDTVFHGAVGIPAAPQSAAPSCVLEGAGYVYLRTNTGDDANEIRLNYRKNFDRLEHDRFTTFFFQNGKQIDGTVGRIVYSHPASGWMERTQAHNCIVVNGEDAAQMDGKLLFFSDLAGKPSALVQTRVEAPFYQGVLQTRAIALVGDVFVVIDRISAKSPCTIDRYQHGQGDAQYAEPTAALDTLPPLCPEIGRFTNPSATSPTRSLQLEFANGLRMRLVSDKPMVGYKATTFRGYQGQDADITFARVADETDVTFAAAFRLNPRGEDRHPPELKIENSDAERVVVALGSGENVTRVEAGIKDRIILVTE